ncbi:ABC transporter ATP-binding protein [Enterococcus florum]|uniref:ABC transporter ATP-binding protein n=1 Tax=Enterococcus florum TaxID=2480627 RepID=A0A4P5PA33_9ENTE|nr:ABC transporter ATP-binding protein [Enterococcus florum]GCF94947.1 ABC transporter ATP-binding protein [Enterococcus florum]
MNLLEVEGVSKHYPNFTLKHLSFSLPQGQIMGLIGKNGAGKSTTLKSLVNLIHADEGRIEMFGQDFLTNEESCKQKLGIVLGGIDFYQQKKLSVITAVTKCFYPEWDDAAYEKYMKTFSIDPQKKVKDLSTGMKVKYMLALALSHRAKLLILDEPTSGLDPVSREDLLVLFRQLVDSGERSILFSTHITTDLEKCADSITYIKDGKMVKSAAKTEFIQSFKHLRKPGEGALSLEEIMVRMERTQYDL